MAITEFGFLREKTSITWSEGEIAPLENHAEIVSCVELDYKTSNGYIYAPLRSVNSSSSALVPRPFELPVTHRLELSDDQLKDDYANFIILFFGMLKGMRLQPKGWQHFYKAPIERKLADFDPTDAQIIKTLDLASSTWRKYSRQKNGQKIVKQMFSALHWHLFAQLYEHSFERFNAQYMALDACAKLAELINFPGYPKGNVKHFEKVAKLCMCTNVDIPTWGVEKNNTLTVRRNALIHEALYNEQPIGFADSQEGFDLNLELQSFVAKIYLSLLGVRNEYTHSRYTTAGVIGFSYNINI